MFSLNKGKKVTSFQKQTRISRIKIINRFLFCNPQLTMIFRNFTIFLFLAFFLSCGTTKQIDIYNPFPDKDIRIEQKMDPVQIPMKLNFGIFCMVLTQSIQ